METKFVVDLNVGRLAKWLRVMGYDALFVADVDDDELIRIALREERIALTRDTQIAKRRVATSGRIRVILLQDDSLWSQLRQVVDALNLNPGEREFSLCIECNQRLVPRSRDEVQSLVPPYVFRTQLKYMQCPSCHKLYWRGTHWQRMREVLQGLGENKPVLETGR